MRNRFAVGQVGKKIEINNLAPRPELAPDEALELAAYLVAVAVPMQGGDAGVAFDRFLHDVISCLPDSELAAAIRTDEG